MSRGTLTALIVLAAQVSTSAPLTVMVSIPPQIEIVERIAGDMAVVGRFLAGNDPQQSRLATAVGTGKSHPVSGIDAKCNVFE